MKGNRLSNYYSEVGSFRGAIKIGNKWIAAKDLNRIDKSKMCRWQGPPSAALSRAMEKLPIRAEQLLPHLAIKKEISMKQTTCYICHKIVSMKGLNSHISIKHNILPSQYKLLEKEGQHDNKEQK